MKLDALSLILLKTAIFQHPFFLVHKAMFTGYICTVKGVADLQRHHIVHHQQPY
uniref:Uncharacterized protein n=1 Tax=Anguilla anguilla TaxID=7936 RepID=A0A0E9Q155_ANGAN